MACPTREQLEQFLEDQIEETLRDSFSRHVESCPACQITLEKLTENALPSERSYSQIAGTITDLSRRSLFLGHLKECNPFNGRTFAENAPGNEPRPWPTIPGFDLVRELGRGGMGVVYLARQKGVNRLVGLKMMRSGLDLQSRERERFFREAEAVGRLRHPNIVDIYDVGEVEGTPYLALEYIEGGSLGDCLRGDPQPIEPTVRLLEMLARAIHHAHHNGIIHRDLKPANILIHGGWHPEQVKEKSGGTDTVINTPSISPQSLIAKITDFGLAKRIDDPQTRTSTGDIVGTPSYMAPEQAGAAIHLIGPGTDVYALGAVLYEMLTGRPPFKGATAVETVVQVLHRDPVRPGSLRPDLPRDLETICLTCLAKEPARRYPTAEALADDLARFRRGKPISARPVGLLERAIKWARRHPLPASLLLSLVLVTVLGFVAVSWQWRKTLLALDRIAEEKHEKEQEREAAEIARTEATAQRRQARVALYGSRIAQSQLFWRVNDFRGAHLALQMCVPAHGREDRRGWEWYYLRRLYQSSLYTLRHDIIGGGGAVIHSPRGGLLASVLAGTFAQDKGELRIWEAVTGKSVLVKPVAGETHRLVFSPSGDRIALATSDGKVSILDSSTGSTILSWKAHDQTISSIDYNSDGKNLITASWDRSLAVWDVSNGKRLRLLQSHTDRVQEMALHHRTNQLASAGWDGTIRLWNLQTGKVLKTIDAHNAPVFCVAFSPDGRLLASAAQNGNVKIWDLTTGNAMQSVNGLAGAVLNLVFNPDGRYLGYGGSDATVRVWDIELGVERIVFRGHTAPVECVDFSPDGQRLVSCSPRDGTVMAWDLTRPGESGTFARTGSDVEAMAFSRDGQWLHCVTSFGKLQTWNRATGVLKDEQDLSHAIPSSLAFGTTSFSPGGELLVTTQQGAKGTLRAWTTATGQPLFTLNAHQCEFSFVGFSGDGKHLITTGSEQIRGELRHSIRVWDVKTQAQRAVLSTLSKPRHLAIHPEGEWIAWGDSQGRVNLSNWRTGQLNSDLPRHKGAIVALAFSPDGKWLASTGEEDRTIQVVRIQMPSQNVTGIWDDPRILPVPGTVLELAFAPDSKRLAGITRDVVKLWDPESKLELLTLRGAPQRYWDGPFNPRILFTPDGTGLAGTNWDESISLWESGVGGDSSEQAGAERIAFWHLQEAEQCMDHRNRLGALFHFQRMMKTSLPRPLDLRKDRLKKMLVSPRK